MPHPLRRLQQRMLHHLEANTTIASKSRNLTAHEVASANFPCRIAQAARGNERKILEQQRARKSLAVFIDLAHREHADHSFKICHMNRNSRQHANTFSSARLCKILKAPSSRHAAPASHRYSAATQSKSVPGQGTCSLAICSFDFYLKFTLDRESLNAIPASNFVRAGNRVCNVRSDHPVRQRLHQLHRRQHACRLRLDRLQQSRADGR